MSESFDYNGTLEAGEDVIVDAETMEVTEGDEFNRSEDYEGFSGDFIHLLAGDNTIEYTDSETGRTVKIEIIREDRHV